MIVLSIAKNVNAPFAMKKTLRKIYSLQVAIIYIAQRVLKDI